MQKKTSGLKTAVGQLKQFLESTQLLPAQREMMALSPRSEAAKAALDRASAELSRLEGGGALSRIPLFGKVSKKDIEKAQADKKTAAAEMSLVSKKARELKGRLQACRRDLKVVEKLAAKVSAGPAPNHLRIQSDTFVTRVGFVATSNFVANASNRDLIARTADLMKLCRDLIIAWDNPEHALTISMETNRAENEDDKPVRHNRVVERRKGRASQLALDFDGTGQIEEEPRIYLPVSASRTKEMVALGVHIDKEAPRRGSQMFIPVSERDKIDSAYLPIAFRKEPTPFRFPPIRHNAVGQNLWSVFDKPSWNHIRTTAYDRAGHRCQICGKQGGSLWTHFVTEQERRQGGLVDCHEVWEWIVPDPASYVGIQRLVRVLVLCKDCHLIFHESFAMWKAREAGLEKRAHRYIKSLQMLINRCDAAALQSQIDEEAARWEDNKSIRTWVLDLEHLSRQDFMDDHKLVLQTDNRAGMKPGQIAGIPFYTEAGHHHPMRTADVLIHDLY